MKIIKTVSALLAALMVCAALAACGTAEEKPKETTPGPDEVVTNSVINAADLGNYTVIRPERAGSAIITAAIDLKNRINENFSTQTTIKDDFFKEGSVLAEIGDYEILIGDCNRDESRAFYADLKSGDYGYRVMGKKIVVGGLDQKTTLKAVELFVKNIVERDAADGIFISTELDYIFRLEQPVDKISVQDNDIGEYKIVYAGRGIGSEESLAYFLQKEIMNLCGTVLEVTADSGSDVSEKEIRIGDTNRATEAQLAEKNAALLVNASENDYYIGSDGTYVWLTADSVTAQNAAVAKFIDYCTPQNGEKTISVKLTAPETAVSEDEEINVMSFNILTTAPDAERRQRVIDMVLKYMPDTVGMQEVSPNWMTILVPALSEYYAAVGEGRNGGNSGEYNTIFYRKDKFKLLESGTKWLSDTPDTKNTKFSNSAYPRIMTYALLERISDGKVILHVNTHLDHRAASQQVRVKQATVLINEILNLESCPTIITGDFNCRIGTEEYKVVDNSDFDSADSIKLSGESGQTVPNNSDPTTIIDFIFVKTNTAVVTEYYVCNEKINNDYPSDHFPIRAKLVILG